jgi:hypothetical protein
MQSVSWITIFWAEYLALSLAASRGLKTCHAPSAPRIAHGPHHGTLSVARDVADGVAHAVARKSLPECSFWAAGARPIRFPARAAALLLLKDATGFRALSLKPASLLRKAQASLPVPRSHRAPAGQGQKQNPRGGQRRKLAASARQRHFRRCPPALPRPTGGLFPRFAQSYPDRQSGALRASTKHRIGRVWGRSLLYRSLGLAIASSRDRLSQRWGASFSLLRLGASHHGSPAWGPAQTSPLSSESFLPLPSAAGTTTHTFALGNTQTCLLCAKRKGCGRSPNQKQIPLKTAINSDPNIHQSSTNARPNQNKELINCYAAH